MGGDFFSWTVANSLRERLKDLYNQTLEDGRPNRRPSGTDQTVFKIHPVKLVWAGPDVTVRGKMGLQACQWLPGEHNLTISRSV